MWRKERGREMTIVVAFVNLIKEVSANFESLDVFFCIDYRVSPLYKIPQGD